MQFEALGWHFVHDSMEIIWNFLFTPSGGSKILRLPFTAGGFIWFFISVMFSGEWVGSLSSPSIPDTSGELIMMTKKLTSGCNASSASGSQEDSSSADTSRITGDEAMSREYISKLLPAFTSLFLQQAMQPNMRRAALTLVRKMSHFCPADLMLQLASNQSQVAKVDDADKNGASQYPECSPLAVQLVQVIAAVLDNEVLNFNLHNLPFAVPFFIWVLFVLLG